MNCKVKFVIHIFIEAVITASDIEVSLFGLHKLLYIEKFSIIFYYVLTYVNNKE